MVPGGSRELFRGKLIKQPRLRCLTGLGPAQLFEALQQLYQCSLSSPHLVLSKKEF